MAVPLLVTWRMHITYIVALLTHTINFYCDAHTVSGDYLIIPNDGGADITGAQAAGGVVAGMQNGYSEDDITGTSWQLQELVGFSWLTRDSGVTGFAGQTGVGTQLAGQTTFVLRDISSHQAKSIFLETYFSPAYHYVAIPASDLADMYAMFTAADTGNTYRPWRWMLSRGGNRLLDDPLIGVTGDLNDRVRRARGLQ